MTRNSVQARTKNEAIVTDRIAPFTLEEIAKRHGFNTVHFHFRGRVKPPVNKAVANYDPVFCSIKGY